MFRLVHATSVHPSLCLSHSNPTVTVTVTIATVSLLLLLLINFCEQELFLGAAKLTTQLLRLASILWLPLCQINKLGNTTREDYCDPLYLWVINASNIVSHPRKSRKASVPMISVRIGDHCYYGLCDIGASSSAIPYDLY